MRPIIRIIKSRLYIHDIFILHSSDNPSQHSYSHHTRDGSVARTRSILRQLQTNQILSSHWHHEDQNPYGHSLDLDPMTSGQDPWTVFAACSPALFTLNHKMADPFMAGAAITNLGKPVDPPISGPSNCRISKEISASRNVCCLLPSIAHFYLHK